MSLDGNEYLALAEMLQDVKISIMQSITEVNHKVDERFEMQQEFNSLIMQRITEVNHKVDELDGRFDVVMNKVDELDGRFDMVMNKVDELDGRFDMVMDKLADNQEKQTAEKMYLEGTKKLMDQHKEVIDEYLNVV